MAAYPDLPEQMPKFENDEENSFREELSELLNAHCMENESNTPDFILAKYLEACLEAFDVATNEREKWYGVHLSPGYRGADE